MTGPQDPSYVSVRLLTLFKPATEVNDPGQGLPDRYAGSTVLVTGGLGFLGSALVDSLSAVSCTIVLLVRQGRSLDLSGERQAKVAAIHGDLESPETWQRALDGADYIFHFASQTSTYVANRNPLADLRANVVPVLQLLETCRQRGLKPSILFSGTVTQMGLPPRLPVDEGFQDNPVVIYDIHKLVAEKYLQYFSRDADIPTVTLRLANVYGPGARVSSQDRGVLNQMIRRGLEGQALTVYGTGERVRDYIYIEDVVRAFLVAGVHADELKGNYYIIGSGTGFRIVDAMNLVADRVEKKTGRRPLVEHVSHPGAFSTIEARDFVANTSRFRSSTDWVPLVPLAEGIDRTLDYFLAEKNGSGAP